MLDFAEIEFIHVGPVGGAVVDVQLLCIVFELDPSDIDQCHPDAVKIIFIPGSQGRPIYCFV